MSQLESLMERARTWMRDDPDANTRAATEALLRKGDESALMDCFGDRLQFGTAGLRGVIGPGPNRMNRALVRRVSAGLGRYVLDHATRPPRVVVANDARIMSPEFGEDVARVLGGMGLSVVRFSGFTPTPVLAFAVKALGAAAGVVVTASHNPPEYNGYKVYWDNGAQIIPPHDTGISAAIDAIDSLEDVAMPSLDELRDMGALEECPESIVDDYFAAIAAEQRHPGVPRDLAVVYTPLHGVGAESVERALREAKLERLHVVAEQREPDGAFPTVRFPNPEEDGALDLALALAAATDSELILANDPDVDRLAVAVPTSPDASAFRLLTGNEIGSLLGYYLLTENLPAAGEPLVMTTVVSSRLLSRIAKGLGAHYDETLTGFKWIANASVAHQAQGRILQMGYEEALGYTVGLVTPDKDGVSAALLFTELAAVCKSRGQTVLEYLEAIHRRFGLHVSDQVSITLPGREGASLIASLMEKIRRDPPSKLSDGTRIESTVDYLPGHGDLPPSNVLAFDCHDGSRILARPSGTEPKIKFYFELVEHLSATDDYRQAQARGQERMAQLQRAFLAQVDGLPALES